MATSDDDALKSDPPEMVDGELHVVLTERMPGDPAKGRVPRYRFELRAAGHDGAVGHVNLRVGDAPQILGHVGHIGFVVEEVGS